MSWRRRQVIRFGGIELASLGLNEPTLDDVFLAKTGAPPGRAGEADSAGCGCPRSKRQVPRERSRRKPARREPGRAGQPRPRAFAAADPGLGDGEPVGQTADSPARPGNSQRDLPLFLLAVNAGGLNAPATTYRASRPIPT